LYDPTAPDGVREAILRRLVRERPAEARPGLLLRVADLPEGKDLAWTVLSEAMDAEPDAAEPVLDAYRGRFPDEHWGPLLEMRLRIKQGDFEEAERLFRARVAGLDGEERRGVLYSFLEYMTEAGRPVEGYRVADPPDADNAFRILASFLERDSQEGGGKGEAARARFRALIAAHKRVAGETPWTAFYTGMVLQEEQQYEEAQAAYADAIERLRGIGLGQTPLQKAGLHANWEDRTWDRARSARVECLYQLGRWEQAYDECAPAASTFDQLAQRLEGRKDWDRLGQLVARHRGKAPADPKADLWQAVAHFGRREHEQAVAAAGRYFAAVPDRTSQHHLALKVKVRSEVRLGKVDDARKTFQAHGRLPAHGIEEILIAAKAGDGALLERHFGDRMTNTMEDSRADALRPFYDDEDVGPLLRSERYAELRKKYPPPDRE
jgi:tetratricopeptide (TPR) repeat protein